MTSVEGTTRLLQKRESGKKAGHCLVDQLDFELVVVQIRQYYIAGVPPTLLFDNISTLHAAAHYLPSVMATSP